MARWRGSCGSAELALLLLLHFWPVRNKKLKKNNPSWKQTMDTGILLRISHSDPKTTNGEVFHISTGISVPNMLKEIKQV